MGNLFHKSKTIVLKRTECTESNDISSNSSTDEKIRRLAIDQSAVIGSLYDARQDCFLEKLLPKIHSTSTRPEEPPKCRITNGTELRDKSLVDLLHIDKDLCLSVRLNMVSSSELLSLINYRLTTNTLTQILYYYYVSEKKCISNDRYIVKMNILESIQNVTVTHVCTAIKSGVFVATVLHLPSYDDNNESDYNSVLREIETKLTENIFNFNENELRLLDRITCTNVFSNITAITKLTKLTEICQKITEIKPHLSQHLSLEYELQPIGYFCHEYSLAKATYTPLNPTTRTVIRKQWYELSVIKKPWEILIDAKRQRPLDNHIKQQFIDLQQQISTMKEMYQSEIETFLETVRAIRSGILPQDSSTETLIVEQVNKIREKMNNVTEQFTALMRKAELIDRCHRKGIEYCNVQDIVKDNDYSLEAISKQLLEKDKQKRIFCFDDKLEQQNSTQWTEFYSQLIKDREKNRQIKYVYADFSYCSCRLSKLEVLQATDNSEQQKSCGEDPASQATSTSSEQKPQITNFINVLLLGESGVGKSTFINAIVNYLKFESLEEARSGQPIVLMPVSFLTTVGDHFEERIVTFGDKDPNEDYDHPGQSVTQHCRSYVFNISSRTKIRLIDTPGMGDTRGLAQDDLNMQHILSFINNLSHLTAICMLLKPNEARLNVVFRSYFTRLLGFLGENFRNNIVFCFTNTRGTFFAPGDTGPLLKQMLRSHAIKDIPFKKTNTFCFDNESFRYLVARLNGIEFDDYQTEEYKRSWTISVTESNRLLQYICNELQSYLQQEWQSAEHAQFQIIQLIRPMLETTRNTMRNIILQKEKPSKRLIKLFPEMLSCPSKICTTCKRIPQCHSDFVVLPDNPHIGPNKCQSCKCSRKVHVNIDYKLTYRTSNDSNRQSYNELKSSLEELKTFIRNLAYFFTHIVSHSEADDPILITLTRMITDENEVCSSSDTKSFNSNLYNELNRLREKYKQKRNTPMSQEKSINLLDIYELIKNISEIDSIREQLKCIKQFHQNCMEQQEKKIS
jgi:ribosome biogenesis GTPase A